MKQKLFLFDCDETLWRSVDADYISSKDSKFEKESTGTIIRIVDKKRFSLKKGVFNVFKLLENKKDCVVGIVSDNKKSMVIEALKLFDLWNSVNPKTVNIQIWDGYCPKQKMVCAILKKGAVSGICRNNIYWIDDKDYTKEACSIGVNFRKVNTKTDLAELIQGLL